MAMPCVQADLRLFTIQGYPYTVPTIPFLPFPFPLPPSLPDVSACRVPPSSAKPWLMSKPLSVSVSRSLLWSSVVFTERRWSSQPNCALFVSECLCVFFFSHPLKRLWFAQKKKKNPPFRSFTFLVCFQPSLHRSRTKTNRTLFRFLPPSSS